MARLGNAGGPGRQDWKAQKDWVYPERIKGSWKACAAALRGLRATGRIRGFDKPEGVWKFWGQGQDWRRIWQVGGRALRIWGASSTGEG